MPDAFQEAIATLAILAIPMGIAALHGHLAQNKLHKALKPDEKWRTK
jgi:hypothetical protein